MVVGSGWMETPMRTPIPPRLVLILLAFTPLVAAGAGENAGAPPGDAARKDEQQSRAAGLLPGEMDTRDRLAQKLPEINLDGAALDEVIDFLRDVAGLNIFVDWQALKAAGVERDAPVKVAARNILMHEAVDKVLESAAGGKKKLRADAVGGVVIVSTPKGVESTRAHFRRLKDNGPAGKIGEQLRQPVPEVNFDGTPFDDVVDFLRDVTGANLFVDWNALEKAKVDRHAPVNLRLKNVPLDQTLRLILDSAGGNKAVLDFKVEGDTITVSVAPGVA
jgi:hypothetical protein